MNSIDVVMANVLDSSAVDRRFKSRSNQTIFRLTFLPGHFVNGFRMKFSGQCI
jgi:hypothetical protein